MNSLEKASIVLMLVLIGALAAAHRRQVIIDREAARIIPDAMAAQQRYFDRQARSQLDAPIGDSIVAGRGSAAERSFYLNIPGSATASSNNVAVGYNALDQRTTGTENVMVGDLCPKGWHLVPDREHPGIVCVPTP